LDHLIGSCQKFHGIKGKKKNKEYYTYHIERKLWKIKVTVVGIFLQISRSKKYPVLNPQIRKVCIVSRYKNEESLLTRLKKIGFHISNLHWEMVQEYLLDRIHRIHNISECLFIYIGSAGTNAISKHTLAGRYQDFKKRHTVQYPIWALLYFGWELQYGWKMFENPAETESQLKEQYRARHQGKLPALVAH
jgi:hypothetical protein